MHMNTVKHRRMDDTIKCSRCTKCLGPPRGERGKSAIRYY